MRANRQSGSEGGARFKPSPRPLSADALPKFETALGILRLQERQRVALFLRQDEFKRFYSALVFVPRDRYDTHARERIHHILAQAFNGRMSSATPRKATGASPMIRRSSITTTTWRTQRSMSICRKSSRASSPHYRPASARCSHATGSPIRR